MILGAFVASSGAGKQSQDTTQKLMSLTDPGPMAKFAGRKLSIWIACALCIVSNVVMMTTTSIGGLYAGRLVIGLANGLFMTFAQLYLQVCLT